MILITRKCSHSLHPLCKISRLSGGQQRVSVITMGLNTSEAARHLYENSCNLASLIAPARPYENRIFTLFSLCFYHGSLAKGTYIRNE